MQEIPRGKRAAWLFRKLEDIVLGWTAFTTVFIWTVANRGLWRPTISSASIGHEGAGRTLSFWVLLGLAPIALGLFYLHGRRRLKPLLWTLLISWHGALAAIAVYLALLTDGTQRFVGDTWGWEVPLDILALLLTIMAVAATAFVFLDAKSPTRSPRAWSDIGWKPLLASVLLTPFVAFAFRLGDGYDWSARIATAAAIMQWLLAVYALDHDPARRE